MRIVECQETGRILWKEWKCHCGRKVFSEGSGGDVSCDCGQLFNAFGQRLVDPCLWEENEDY